MERKSNMLPLKHILNKPQIVRSLGSNLHTNVSHSHAIAGRSIRTKVQHCRHKHLYDTNHQIRAKPDLNTTLPVRQTASIFKQPVTKVTNHPSNKVKSDPQRAVDQPKQLFWERKLSGLNAFDIAEELVKTMALPRGLQGVGPACSDKTLLSVIASALHTSHAPVTGQLTAAVEKNPGVWLNTTQPLCRAFVVTDEDISFGFPVCSSSMVGHVSDLSLSGHSHTFTFSSSETLDDDPVPTINNNQWHSQPVLEWNNQQVCLWLIAMNMDHHASEFAAKGVDGTQLLTLDSEKLKALGVCSHSDRSVLKRKLKEMKKSEENGQRRMREKNAVLNKEMEVKEKAKMTMGEKSVKGARRSGRIRTESLL